MTLTDAINLRLDGREKLDTLKQELDEVTKKLVNEIEEHLEPCELLMDEGLCGIELSANGRLYVRYTYGATPIWSINPSNPSVLAWDANALRNFRERVRSFLHLYAHKYTLEIANVQREIKEIEAILR